MSDDIIRVGDPIPEVIFVKVLGPYTLMVSFADGHTSEIAFEETDFVGVLKPLKAPEYFAQAFVDPETKTVAWPNGVDLDPCVLRDPSLRAGKQTETHPSGTT